MSKMSKRGLSLLLTLVLCLSLLSGINFSVYAAQTTVTYRYDGSYVYNWGTREETATFLSPMAIDYYEEKNTSFEELAALKGNSNQSSAGSSALYYELQEIMSSGAKSNSYDANKTLSKYTDCQNNGNWNGGKISSFYSGTGIGPSWNGEWNREHTWPNSKGGGNCENIFMIRPTSYSENSSRGNTAYGKSSGYYNPNNESGGKHDLRGDVARLMLGIWVRYGSNSTIKGKMWGSSGVMESKAVLLEWIEADPVDTWELGRNDSVESILNFRNVFVDYPELAFELFEAEIPTDMETPSGIAADRTSYIVTATVNSSAYGSVSVSGKVITATPATGYEVSGYTVVSGQATVIRDGNVFTIAPTSDCQIKINFAKRTSKQASFYGNSAFLSTITGYSGDQITLPSYTGQVVQGYTFAGWVTQEVEETTDKQTFVSAGAKYTLTENVNFYALFTRKEEGTTGTAEGFTRYTGALTEGDYILTYEGYAMVAEMTTANKDRLQYTAVTVKNDTIENPAANIVWHISFVDNSKVTIYNQSVNKYAGSASASNKARLLDSADSKAYWTYTGTSTYEFSNVYNANNGLNKLLHKNGNVGFGCYSSGTGGALTLYKGSTVTTYYTTGPKVEIPSEDVVVEYTYEVGGETVTDTYDSLEEALQVATDGVVTLQSDVSADTVVVKPNVTLDLNGYTLYADALIAMNGAIVCDGGAACTGGGLLSVPQGNLALAKENGDGIVAVWNGVDGYIFTKVTFQQTTASAAAGKARYIFLPSFSNEDATALFADGALDNELSVKVCLSWNDGYSQQFYTYSDDLVERVYDGTGSLAFDLTVTGMAGIADMVASPVVVTASGAQATTFGTALTAN